MLKAAEIQGILKECRIQTSRSGGKGGQNVNKVESRVELNLDVKDSAFLSETRKSIILSRYPNLIDGSAIRLVSSKYRSQLQNKQDAQERLIALLNKLLKPVKKRKATRPSKSSKEKKLKEKKRHGEIKQLRKKIF